MRRLVLFDIDGTVLSGGPAKDAFRIALVEVFGTAGPIATWEFSGKTDPQIARELLTEAGLEKETIDRGLPSLWRRYVEELEARLPGCPTRPLPGVPELLGGLAESGAAIGWLTGNVIGGARLKLDSAGLGGWLSVGAFGSDHEVRRELPPIALRRAQEHWGDAFASGDVVVVGDTPRDVDCGRAHGTRTVAVATGRFASERLRETGADAVLESLEGTGRALTAILG
jgi:phosphoglycolate phosphatase